MNNAVMIENSRTGYTPRQCGRTFTVGELIEFLEQFDEELPIYLSNDNGYTYGSISESCIEERKIEELQRLIDTHENPNKQAKKQPPTWAEGHDTPAECATIGGNFERQKRVVTRFFRVTTLIFVAESALLQKKEIESSGEFIETAQYRHKKSSRITKK